MPKRILILAVFFYILTLFQISFLVHFNIFNLMPNFILILTIFINIFEKPSEKLGIWAAFIGGFYLDIFSYGLLGLQILILIAAAILIKIIKSYVQIPNIKRA